MYKYEIIISFIVINTIGFFVYRHVDTAAAASTAIAPQAREPAMRFSEPPTATRPSVTPIAPGESAQTDVAAAPDIATAPPEATKPAPAATGPDTAAAAAAADADADDAAGKAKPTARHNKVRRSSTAGSKGSPSPSGATTAAEPADDLMKMEANPYKRGE